MIKYTIPYEWEKDGAGPVQASVFVQESPQHIWGLLGWAKDKGIEIHGDEFDVVGIDFEGEGTWMPGRAEFALSMDIPSKIALSEKITGISLWVAEEGDQEEEVEIYEFGDVWVAA